MAADIRPAMPMALSKATTPRRDRLLAVIATATVVLTATVAVMVVAMSAVVLGLT